MAKKNFEIYEFWLGLVGISWRDAIGLSLTSRVCLEAGSADRMLHAAHCAWRTAPSAPSVESMRTLCKIRVPY